MMAVRTQRWYQSRHLTRLVERDDELPFAPYAGLDVLLHADSPGYEGRDIGVVCIDRVLWDNMAGRWEVEEYCRITCNDDMSEELDACLAHGWHEVALARHGGR